MSQYRSGVVAWAIACALCGCDFETAESVTESAVERTVEVGRGVSSGVVQGARAGREDTASTDGALVVADWDRLEAHGGVEVTEVRADGDATVVTLRFSNESERPLRIARLDHAGALLALDRERVATPARETPGDFTVHPQARHPIEVRFSLDPDSIGTVRLWGQALELPPVQPAAPES